jgi:aspartyl/asparaginyl-tRNA synthetase
VPQDPLWTAKQESKLGFIKDHHDVMAVLRDAVAGMLDAIVQHCAAAVALLDAKLPVVPKQIPEIDFATALEMIGASTGEDLSGENDLAPAHRAVARRMGGPRARLRARVRHRLPHEQTPVLHPP